MCESIHGRLLFKQGNLLYLYVDLTSRSDANAGRIWLPTHDIYGGPSKVG